MHSDAQMRSGQVRLDLLMVVLMASCRLGFNPGEQPAGDVDAGAVDSAVPGDGAVDSAVPADGAVPADAAAADMDMDGVADLVDNCPDVANAGQFDEDGDSVGDACDNCPHVANPGQANTREMTSGQPPDRVGDACDPRPTVGGDVQLLFVGFNVPEDFADWSTAGPNTYTVEDGLLKQRDNSDLSLAWRNALGSQDQTVQARVTYRNLTTGPGGYQLRGVAIFGMFERNANFGTGMGCGDMLDLAVVTTPRANAVLFNGAGYNNLLYGTTAMSEGQTVTYRATTRNASRVDCTSDFATWNRQPGSLFTGDGVAIATWGTGVDVEYLIVYGR